MASLVTGVLACSGLGFPGGSPLSTRSAGTVMLSAPSADKPGHGAGVDDC